MTRVNIQNEYLKIQSYLNFKIIKCPIYLKQLFNLKNSVIVSSDMESPEDFVNELITYEKKVKRNYKEKEQRFGILYTILLPYSFHKDSIKTKRLAEKFTNHIRQEEKGLLKYCAWQVGKGRGFYLNIYVSDRLYTKKEFVKKYDRTMYINKNTKAFCRKNDPNAILAYEKGQVQKDGDGNPIILTGFLNKTRRFCFKPKFDDYGHDIALQEYYEDLTNLIQRIFSELGINVMPGRYLERLKSNGFMNRYQKRIITANNRCMDFVERNLSYYMNKEDNYKTILDKETRQYIDIKANTKTYKKLETIYFKFKKRFNKGAFHIGDELYVIQNTRCDVVEENLNKLRELFVEELVAIYPTNKAKEIRFYFSTLGKAKEKAEMNIDAYYTKLTVNKEDINEYTEKTYRLNRTNLPKKVTLIADDGVYVENWFYKKYLIKH